MSEKNRKREIKQENLTCAYLGLSPAQPSSSRPAQPGGGPAHLAPLLCRLPPRQRNGACRRARTAAPPPPASLATSCFLLVAWNAPDDATQPRPPSHSLRPPLPLLSLSHPRTTAAADGHHRSHRLPLASPSCPGAPLRRQLPPRRATQAGVPRGAAIAVIFVVGRPRSSAPVRRL